MGANKQISCKICSKAMRSDHLKRHMKKHVNPSSEDSQQICKSILEDIFDNILSKDETSMHSEKPKDPHSDGLDESPVPGDEIDEKEMKSILVLDNYKYAKKSKLGEAIFEIITNDDEIDQKLQHEYEQIL